MRTLWTALPLLLLLLNSCGTSVPEAPPAAKVAQRPKPADEARWFPKKDQVSMTLVDDHAMGKEFLPGGNVARYKKGNKEYDMFLVKSTDNQSAALLTFDYKQTLRDAKLIPHFGGYFGKDTDGREAFVFSKNAWFLGIVGLPEKEADAVAREFAGRLQ